MPKGTRFGTPRSLFPPHWVCICVIHYICSGVSACFPWRGLLLSSFFSALSCASRCTPSPRRTRRTLFPRAPSPPITEPRTRLRTALPHITPLRAARRPIIPPFAPPPHTAPSTRAVPFTITQRPVRVALPVFAESAVFAPRVPARPLPARPRLTPAVPVLPPLWPCRCRRRHSLPPCPVPQRMTHPPPRPASLRPSPIPHRILRPSFLLLIPLPQERTQPPQPPLPPRTFRPSRPFVPTPLLKPSLFIRITSRPLRLSAATSPRLRARMSALRPTASSASWTTLI